jgi:integrase
MHHKYLHRRGNQYHFRWRIPADLRSVFGITELTCSLRTLDLLVANVRANRFVEAVVGIQWVRGAYQMGHIDREAYASELNKYWEKVRSMAKKDTTIRTDYLMYANIKFDYGDDEKDAQALKKAVEMGVVPDPKDMAIEPSQQQVKTESKMLFSELFDLFIVYKIDAVRTKKEKVSPLSEKMLKGYTLHFKTLIEIMGDAPISSITKKMLRDAILTYGMLPKRNKKPYKGLPVLELLEMKVPEADRIGDKVPIEVRKLVQGIFKFAIEEDILDTSPARDLGLNFSGQGTFAQYDNIEVRTMLMASSKESVAWKRWLPPLAAYTGARRGELVQLRKSDIKYDSNSQRHYILVTANAGSVKNENANRQIPLHSELVKMGFLEFVDEADDRLFEGLNPHTLTNWFTDFRIALDIDNCDDTGDRKVFHSFRHTFVTRTRGAGNPDVNVQQVVGHEKTSAGVTDRYTGKMELSVLLSVVDKVTYL